ncbi:MAG: hypothetical protein R3C26_19270 [Calditrichia bacterium]
MWWSAPAQRFGVPMGHGGPHAAFFASREEFKRQVPGGSSAYPSTGTGIPLIAWRCKPASSNIRREKATSNICTAQTLLANMASMYAVYHGPEGLKTLRAASGTLAVVLGGGVEETRVFFRRKQTIF